MDICIKQEEPEHHDTVFRVIESAFKGEELSDHQEQFLVQRLRNSDAFVPELSLVAEYEDEIIGHILLTKIKIKNGRDEFPSLALAPVTVMPDFQNRGIGGLLIREAHSKARKLGFKSIILLGHADYYPRFGYKKANEFGIKLPFEVPDEYCMAIELIKNGLAGVNGTVEYSREFNV